MSARLISSTSRLGVWITTSTESGILWAKPSGRRRVPQADVQFAQLLLVHRAGRLRQQVLRALRLRKSDHVAQAFGTRHQHDETVQADGDAAVRRRAVLQ